jgi:hypothetical protein
MPILSADRARPNWVIPAPLAGSGAATRKMLDLSQRARRSSILEPGVLATVDLDQLT